MTKIYRDVPLREGMTLGDRLKAARADANLTRKSVHEGTGISTSTIEKYESGNMDPSTSRLKAICDFLDVSVNWIINGDDQYMAANSEIAETRPTASVAETLAETTPQSTAMDVLPADNTLAGAINGMLEDLDTMRIHGFDGLARQAMALTDDVLAKLKHLEPGELTDLALERDLYQDETCLGSADILDLLSSDLDAGQAYCGNLEERILDTVILGVDLYSIERGSLVDLADELQENHDIQETAWGGWSWGDHENFIPQIRPIVRSMAFRGVSIDFMDQDQYPRREE